MLKPKSVNVMIERDDSKKITKGGLIIPDVAQKEKNIGVVVSLGDGCQEELKVGDKVIFPKFAGTEIEHEDKKYLIIDEDELIAIVHDSDGEL